MDETMERLGEFLSTPAGAGAVQSVLEMLRGDGAEPSAPEKPAAADGAESGARESAARARGGPEPGGLSGLLPEGLSVETAMKLLPLLGSFGKLGDDPRARLLEALRPYLTGKRAENVDTALQLLKYLRIAETLKDVL